jgi:alpha-D-xyloside xylohydrolase
VNPVTEYKARNRRVYLPSGSAWYDFWTGARNSGGQSITADAPLDRIPLYVRAGAIVPFGPAQRYIGEKSRETITLYVYAGVDGRFSLYEDDGRTYTYEQSNFSIVPLSWDDAARTLTFGKTQYRPSSTHTFNVVLVTADAPHGYAADATPLKVVKYTGDAVRVKF